jgi:hypothetical protein
MIIKVPFMKNKNESPFFIYYNQELWLQEKQSPSTLEYVELTVNKKKKTQKC